MPILHHGDAEIYYEEYGEGFPLLVFAPGGMRSNIAFWRRSPSNPNALPPWMDPTSVLATRFRVIAMDQRNAGRSTAPIAAADGWGTYAGDHLALLDHLEIERTHVMGGCIGSSFCLRLCRDAPARISAAVLQNPIGLAGNAHLFTEGFESWRDALRPAQPAVSDDAFARFERNLHEADFVFSVTRDDVARCAVPLLVMPGDDGPHPTAIGEEIARLAPRAEVLMHWKGPAHLDETIRVVTDFLMRNTPA